MSSSTSVRARFGWFAIGHFCVSAIGLGGMALFFSVMDLWAGWANGGMLLPWTLCAALMALYLPAGYLCAKHRKWSRPSHQRSVLAVLLPALAAWGFAAVGLALSFIDETSSAGLMLLASSAIWASPSFVLMLLSMVGLFLTGGGLLDGFFFIFLFFAGLLPPFLFHLGAIRGAKPVDNGENCDILT